MSMSAVFDGSDHLLHGLISQHLYCAITLDDSKFACSPRVIFPKNDIMATKHF